MVAQRQFRGFVRCSLALLVVATLGACASAPEVTRAVGVNDPYERENRAVHGFNKSVDRALIRPLRGGGDGQALRPVKRGLRNLGDTLETPGRIVNNLLQGRIENAGHNGFRLALNLTIGVGGLFDPATSIGLPARDTDFGETLHVWGTGEGAYLEVPLLGPSTERDLIGDIVDAALNPLDYILPTEAQTAASVVKIGGSIAEQSAFGSTVDEILYDSADSYAQLRLIYLQNRRFELARNARHATGGGALSSTPSEADPYASAEDADYIDPYEELYGP